MNSTAQEIISLMEKKADKAQAAHLMRFFKTGKGEYGEGDRFLGLRVPETREIARMFKDSACLDDINVLLASQWHEIRLCGFMILIEKFVGAAKRHDDKAQEQIKNFYLGKLDCGNNWDLVDLVAPKILGQWLINRPDKRDILYELTAESKGLWAQRVAIVATLPLIKKGEFTDTLSIARTHLSHPHDLIHKATGWMLREAGKNGGMEQLIGFLKEFSHRMPRTMFRYATERMTREEKARCAPSHR